MRNHKQSKLLALLLTVMIVATFWQAGAFAAEGDVILTIIHTNDQHGRMGAAPYVAQLAKDTGGNVLILDAGDALHGQITANQSKGSSMVEIMNLTGYAAMAPGNHDFNYGFDRLLELSAMMDFPLLSANVKKANGENLLTPYEIITLDGLTVGLFGLTTPETLSKTDPRNVAGLTFADPATAATDMVGILQGKGCDVIIALTHLGVDNATAPSERSSALAQVAGIDLIIDGHSHTRLEGGQAVGGALLGQTGAYGENIGVITLTKSGSAITKEAKLIAISGDEDDALATDAAVVTKVAELDASNDAMISRVVGHTPVLLQGERGFVRVGETNLANLISDSMRFATGADVAFLTGGNIRASIDAGDITVGDVLTTLPFSNLLMTVELKGADLLKVFEHGISNYPEAAASLIHISGAKFSFDPGAASGSRVTSATMADGSALDPGKVYTVATSEFLVAGGDGYDMMLDGVNSMYYQGDAEALIDYLATKPAIAAEAEGRYTAIASAVPAPADIAPPVETATAPAIVTPVHPIGVVYTVKEGDVLWKIAANIGTTWQELQRLNSLANPNLIHPGQVLIIP